MTDNDKLDAAGKGEGTTIDFGYLRDQPVVMKKIALSEFQPTKQNEKELENVSPKMYSMLLKRYTKSLTIYYLDEAKAVGQQ